MPTILVVIVLSLTNPGPSREFNVAQSVSAVRFDDEGACARALDDIRQHVPNAFVMCEPAKTP
jgi:hypothetical protein